MSELRVTTTLDDDFIFVCSKAGALELYNYLKSQFVNYDSPEMWRLMRSLGAFNDNRTSDTTHDKDA